MRPMIDEVLADYSGHAVGGALPALADPGFTARAVYDTVAALGPLQRFLDDPEVEENCTYPRLLRRACRRPRAASFG
jgi:pilus assembly protein CpaF